MEDNKDLAVPETTAVQVSSHDTIIEHAIKNGATMDQIEKFMVLKERHEAYEANKAYCREIAVVQQQIPTVAKNKTNPLTKSKYASLDKIISETKQIYTARGFSVSFREGDSPKEEHIRIFADVRHAAGHKETSFFDMPLDGKGLRGNSNMTAIHGKKSSVSYGRNVLMCLIWNIPTGDDDDGNKAGASTEYISNEQLSTIRDFIDNKNVDLPRFLKHFKIEIVEELPKKRYQEAVVLLEAK